jgi:glycosyltransferase involved in cell wall biosynthesis
VKVLAVTTQLPYPPRSGSAMRTLSLLKRLCARHEITVLAHARDDDPAVDAMENLGMKCLPVEPPRRGMLSRASLPAWSSIGPLPYIMAKHCTAAMRRALEEAARSGAYDLLHCDSISLAPLAANCGLRPALLAEHNVEALIWQRLLEFERRPLHRAFIALQARKLRSVESACCRAFDACVAVSEPDALLLREWYGVENVEVVPNGVEPDVGLDSGPARDGRLAFIGAMDWFPNQDAVRWMVDDILPLVRKRTPRVTLTLAGRNPPRWMKRLSADGIRVTGTVEDVSPYLREAAVCVVPLRIGGGTRLKILEALAAGKPVVSTAVGAEGLDLRDFAEQVAGLLEDGPLRERLAAAGRRAAKRYAWDSIAPALERVWLTLVAPGFKRAGNCGR